jgi:glycosyltransferase involved in cell wall biosynthesis
MQKCDRKKLTLVYVITKAELGGAQMHVYDLIKSLYYEYEIHLVVGNLGWLTDKCGKLGVSCHHLPILDRNINLLKDLRAVREFVALVKQIKPDIIHAHSGKPGLIARLSGAICHVPVVFTAHGWSFDPNAPKLRRNVAFVVEKLLTPLAAKIICVSESDRQLAIGSRVAGKDQIVTIHNGIDHLDAPIATPAINPPQLIVVARFNKQQKDHETLMRAIKTIDRDFKVLFVGTGPDWEEAKTIAKNLNILSKVTFLGDRLDVQNLLAQSQLFILTTHYEGLPISILEAMRAGLPVIATNVNGIPEQVEDGLTGLLVPRQDVQALTTAILTLLKDPVMRRNMGDEGSKKLAKEFTGDRMVAKTRLIYQYIIPDQYCL